jgi:hypothetical protein
MGGIFGLVLTLFSFMGPFDMPTQLDLFLKSDYLRYTLYLPFFVAVWLSDGIQWAICQLSEANFCLHLGAERILPIQSMIQEVSFYAAMILCYGILFLIIYKLIVKKKVESTEES